MQYTHKQMLAKECTYDEYMQQFVDDTIENYVVRWFGLEELAVAYRVDKHLNSIRLTNWDQNVRYFRDVHEKARQAGEIMSLAFQVSLLKQAARSAVLKKYPNLAAIHSQVKQGG